MNPEIRFNPPPRETSTETEKEKREGIGVSKKNILSVFTFSLKLLGVIVVLVGIVFLVKYLNTQRNGGMINNDAYSAVFLSNDQVYFGKIAKDNKSEIMMTNVYYLQINKDGTMGEDTLGALNQSRFTLIKLGQELHGPTDELFISKSQVMFREYLRDDSKVVELIKNQK